MSVAPTIQQLLGPERDHHWCIPFSVTGNPKPRLQWYHENKLLLEQDYIRTMIHLSTESEYHGCLQLVNPTHIHNGMYKLVAKNEYGRDEKTVYAQFIDPPYDHTGVIRSVRNHFSKASLSFQQLTYRFVPIFDR